MCENPQNVLASEGYCNLNCFFKEPSQNSEKLYINSIWGMNRIRMYKYSDMSIYLKITVHAYLCLNVYQGQEYI